MSVTSLIRRLPRFSPSGYKMQTRFMYKQGKHKIYTMDDLPVPKGSWKDYHDQNNSYFNKILIFGIIMFSGVITFGSTTGCIYYRYKPPKTYEEEG